MYFYYNFSMTHNRFESPLSIFLWFLIFILFLDICFLQVLAADHISSKTKNASVLIVLHILIPLALRGMIGQLALHDVSIGQTWAVRHLGTGVLAGYLGIVWGVHPHR